MIFVEKTFAMHVHKLALGKFYGQANGLISTGQLNTLLCLHTQPINVVVFYESHREYLSSVELHA